MPGQYSFDDDDGGDEGDDDDGGEDDDDCANDQQSLDSVIWWWCDADTVWKCHRLSIFLVWRIDKFLIHENQKKKK